MLRSVQISFEFLEILTTSTSFPKGEYASITNVIHIDQSNTMRDVTFVIYVDVQALWRLAHTKNLVFIW